MPKKKTVTKAAKYLDDESVWIRFKLKGVWKSKDIRGLKAAVNAAVSSYLYPPVSSPEKEASSV